MNNCTGKLTCLLLLAGLVFATPSKLLGLELNRYFSDDMVLQRDKPLKIWGTAKKGETVTVTFAGQKKSAKTNDSGRWVVALDPIPANPNGQTLKLHSTLATRHLTLTNVLVGDVFLFGRQSSIDVSLGTTPEGKKAAGAMSETKALRFIRINSTASRTALNNLKKDATTGWQAVSKKTAVGMSAAAFYLGRDLAKEAKVPIGIVDLNMGYHFAAAWLSTEGAEHASGLEVTGAADVKRELALREKDFKYYDAGGSEGKRGKWKMPDDRVNAKKRKGWAPMEMPYAPTSCYNSVLHPLRGLVVKGILLQHGNDYPFAAFTQLRNIGKHTDMSELGMANRNTYRTSKYGNRMTTCVLPLVIDDLRKSLGDASLPMAWIMPPGSDMYQYGTHNREVRELQRRTQKKSKAVDLILPGANAVPMSGQPADEALLATRCKQWVLGTFYDAEGATTGPIFDRVEFRFNGATIHFKAGTADGLSAVDDALKHFQLAGGSREFVPSTAEIDGPTIKLTTDAGIQPKYVRFGWNRKTVQGLSNSAGLPALPFNTDAEWVYDWWPGVAGIKLPDEYFTPANKWPDRKYSIVNYAIKGGGLHMGPTGIWCSTAGPNLYVSSISPGSPAQGKVIPGDLIYAVNGKEFSTGSNGHYKGVAAGITKAEAEKGGGEMILNIRREQELIEVPIKLEYMGSYSDTTPWNCEKTGRIVKKAAEFMLDGLRPKTGICSEYNFLYGPWNDNAFFLMATGDPKLQGLVRRHMATLISRMSSDLKRGRTPMGGDKGWTGAYGKKFLAEYYLQTGDPSVLPYLEALVRGAEKYIPKDQPMTTPSRFGIHPAAQMPSAMGLILAQEAGIKVDKAALYYTLKHLHDKRAEHGFILYNGYAALTPGGRSIPKPQPLDPGRMKNGTISSMNGKLGTGAALFSLLPGYEKAVKNCSIRCVYAFNKTRNGHGGAWFNNYWTPIGAYHAGKEKFQHFMKGHRWWIELYRDHTGSAWQRHNARKKGSMYAVGYLTHSVIHRKQLRMFGAPRSAFGVNPPAYLKPALAARAKRDYARAESLVRQVIAKGNIPTKEKPMVDHFLNSLRILKESVAHDLAYTEDAIKRGEYYLANLELPQLKMVVDPNNPKFKAIAAALESREGKAKIGADLRERSVKITAVMKPPQAARVGEGVGYALNRIDTLVKDSARYHYSRRRIFALFPKEQLQTWRMKVLENPGQIPDGWFKKDYDDAGWDNTSMQISWPMGHTGIFRTIFGVKDVSAYQSLHVRAVTVKQRNMIVYLNGELVAKVNNMPGGVNFPLPPHALKILKNGKNTLAVSAQHGKRTVHFSFRLEGHLKAGQ